MITGLVISGSSVYLNKMAFAETPWSQIAQGKPIAQKTAVQTYAYKFMFNDLNASQRNWSGLSSSTTGGYGVGRNITAESQTSLENAMSAFNTTHGQYVIVYPTNYTGLNSTTTGENGRDRNALIAQARDEVLNTTVSMVSSTSKLDLSYTTLQSNGTTNEQNAYNRQAQIEKTEQAMASQATPLVNPASKLDTSYSTLQSGPTTGGYGYGLQIPRSGYTVTPSLGPAQTTSLNHAMQVFKNSYGTNLARTQSNGYAGLNSATTNEHSSYDRQAEIDAARQIALQNGLDYYGEYYHGTGLNQTTYSH